MLVEANLRGADLRQALLSGANLRGANLRRALLGEADLSAADLSGADLTVADLSGANLSNATLVETNLEEANLTSCLVYGISAWNVRLKGATQSNLVITTKGESLIQVDNLEVAQFIYLLLKNEKIRDVIDTVGEKAVLILGRFTRERKSVLDGIREALRGKRLNLWVAPSTGCQMRPSSAKRLSAIPDQHFHSIIWHGTFASFFLNIAYFGARRARFGNPQGVFNFHYKTAHPESGDN